MGMTFFPSGVIALAVLSAGCMNAQQYREAAPQPGLTLYVAPNGNDAWSGKRRTVSRDGSDGPFVTLQRARDEIRALRQKQGLPAGGIMVDIQGGRYELNEPFALTGEDSGTAAAPIVYSARKHGSVRLTGGRRVKGWEPVTDPDVLHRLPAEARPHVRQASLKALGVHSYGDYTIDVGYRLQEMVAAANSQGEFLKGSVRPDPEAPYPGRLEVFFDDKPMQISRGPNEGAITIGETLGKRTRTIRGHKSSVEGVFRYMGDYPSRWAEEPDGYVCGSWFRDWAEQRHRIRSLDPETRVLSVERPYHAYGYGKGHWFYGFHMLAELDRAGEWYIDRDAGILYFWPPEPVENATVEVSVAPRLVTMEGVSHVTIQGLIFEACRGTAVAMEDCEHCQVNACTVRNVGMHGASVVGGAGNAIVGCDMYGMGGGGIYLIGGERKTLTPAGHVAENNHIHHYGRWDRMYRPALVLSGVGMRVSHNLIHDAPHSAIIFGGNDHLIEFNEIHSVCFDSNDCGAIYAGRDWTLRGHVIQYNYLHHICGRLGRAAKGIYLDDSFAAATVRGNVFNKVTYAVFLGGGRDNVIENNVFVDSPSAMHLDARGLGWQKPHIEGRLKEVREKGTLRGIRFREPPYSTRWPELLTLIEDEPAHPKGNVVRRNIFWKGTAENLRRMSHGEACADTWWDHIAPAVRHLVCIEDNLINVDPGFVDPEDGDFRLRPDSPALKLGFQPIPVKRIGLRNDRLRASWPPVHNPRSMPALPPKPEPRKTLRTGPAPVVGIPRRTATPITIDGVLDAAEWRGLEMDRAIAIEHGLHHEPVTPASHAWILHDDAFLYVGIRNNVEPDKPLAMGGQWARDDCLEVALCNPASPGAPILVLRGYPNGLFESSAEAKAPESIVRQAGETVRFAAKVVNKSLWTVEYRIPLALLKLSPSGEVRVQCNLSVRKTASGKWYMWQGTGTKTWDTAKAGILEWGR